MSSIFDESNSDDVSVSHLHTAGPKDASSESSSSEAAQVASPAMTSVKKPKKEPTLEDVLKARDRLATRAAKLKAQLKEEREKRQEQKGRYRAQVKELKQRKHKRRSPGVKVARQGSTWIQALKRIAEEDNTDYRIFKKGSEGWNRAKELVILLKKTPSSNGDLEVSVSRPE
jgi:hypothetical protein